MKNPFSRPSIKNALKGINAGIDELHAVIDAETAVIDEREAEIARLTNEIGEANENRSRAERIAGRLSSLVA